VGYHIGFLCSSECLQFPNSEECGVHIPRGKPRMPYTFLYAIHRYSKCCHAAGSRSAVCAAVRRADYANHFLLQPSDLHRGRSAARRKVYLDSWYENVSLWSAYAHRTISAWALWRAVLLSCIDCSNHRVRRRLNNYDGVQPIKKQCLRTVFYWLDGRRYIAASTPRYRGGVAEILLRRQKNYL
jgi:hypothetical protein